MKPKIELINKHFNTSYAPLCVLGHVLWERGTLEILRNFAAIPMKKRDHTPLSVKVDPEYP